MSKLKSGELTYIFSVLYFSLWKLNTTVNTRSLCMSKAIKYTTHISLELNQSQQNLWEFTGF